MPDSRPVLPPQRIEAGPASEAKVNVRTYSIEGATLVPVEQLTERLKPFADRPVSFGELQQAANEVETAYREAGYLARVVLPPQQVQDGRLRMRVIESRMGAVREEGTSRLRSGIAARYLESQNQPGDFLRTERLQHGLNLLNELSGVEASTVLEAGEAEGETRLVLRVENGPLFTGTAQVDNAGSRSTGAARLIAHASLNNPLGIGEQFSATGLKTAGNDYLRLGTRVPVGVSGLKVGFDASVLDYRILNRFATGAHGSANTVGASLAYPLLRSFESNLTLGATLERKHFKNTFQDVPTSDKTVKVGSLSLSGDASDRFGGGGLWQGTLTVSAGKLDLGGNPQDLLIDESSSRRQGSFSRVNLALSRLQKLQERVSLWAGIQSQLSNKNLDASERFVLGGPDGVRAYPVLEGSGDEGWLGTVELRAAATPSLQLTAFYDHGSIKQNDKPWAGWNAANPSQANRYSLKGAGVGVIYTQPGRFVIRGSVARRIGDNPAALAVTGADNDGSLHKLRGWISMVASF